ncbi:hypothetical protein NLG97_g2280 [Lecanicillium saksenae]|uniref:Uncharacterized protein n=1 Tax=Lecanicillium saksenae TaxID=468837 RepID=A0ACC1R1C8_9HYPO|nr:hypothetical protein NLG97_g2280 [Lecanicillium saksenae]
MKISSILASVMGVAPSLACLTSSGKIAINGAHPDLQGATIVDNGKTTCDHRWGTKPIGAGWQITCISGYSMDLASDGRTCWYSTPGGRYNWQQPALQNQNWISWSVKKFC